MDFIGLLGMARFACEVSVFSAAGAPHHGWET